MEKTESRLLEEWKANLDLLKFYETLKQQRFAHFLTIQTAFFAIFGLLGKEAMGAFSLMNLSALVLVPIPPLIVAFYYSRLDMRGRAYIDTANTKLLLIENEWERLFPKSHFSTYQQQFAVLSRRDSDVINEYLGARKLDHDPYASLIQATSAHVSEATILRLFLWLWIVLFGVTLAHLLLHVTHPLWRPI
jgi:hypothetical protein